MNVFAERLAKARKHAGIGKTELARKIGVKPPSVTNYECGKRMPSVETLSKIADVLDVTTDWLLGIEPDNDLTDEEVLSKYSPWFLGTLTTQASRDRAIRSMRKMLEPIKQEEV